MCDSFCDQRATETDLDKVTSMMADQDVTKLYYKILAANDNSKNQPYFGADFSVLNIIPTGELVASQSTSGKSSKSKVKFTAPLNFFWLSPEGTIAAAPNAQLILYPQYPEVRLSGFLLGCKDGPGILMNPYKRGREEERVLFLGIRDNGSVVGYLAPPESAAAKEAVSRVSDAKYGLFKEIAFQAQDNKATLLAELLRIHQLAWIKGKRLQKDGSSVDCNHPNCGGYTLEAELGVTPNGYSEPDFLGWEIKQFGVQNFAKVDAKIITLMTPEPTGGFYKEQGVYDFLQKYGYPDTKGRPDRINFGGVHRVGIKHHMTNLTLILMGYDAGSAKITDASGGIALIDEQDNIAALWNYSHFINHWKRKHAHAAYIPALTRNHGFKEYHYSNLVKLGEGTDFLKFLSAMAKNNIYYDPGIKMENASTTKPKIKRRSQFRVKSGNLADLYNKMKIVNVTSS